MSKIRDALRKIAEAINELAEDKSLDEPVKVHVLSDRDKKLVQLMEDALGHRGGGILVKADNDDGFTVMSVKSPQDVRDIIVKIKAGELELA